MFSCLAKFGKPIHGISLEMCDFMISRENEEAERDIESVGQDTSIPLKLVLV